MTRERVRAVLVWALFVGLAVAAWFVGGYLTRLAYLLGEL